MASENAIGLGGNMNLLNIQGKHILVHTGSLASLVSTKRGECPFGGEGYEDQQAFWVHLPKNFVKGGRTSTPEAWVLSL